jgi:hypothetical protein
LRFYDRNKKDIGGKDMHFGEKIVLNVKVIKKDLSETEKILYYAEAIHTHYGEKTTSFQDAF